MSPRLGFSIDQLMELAGLSVAHALAAEFPAASFPRVLVLVGPGNNGGDALVAARHLRHMGYACAACYPSRDRSCEKSALYRGLVAQCASLGVAFLDAGAVLAAPLAAQADLVLDGLFGFSFSGAPRPPFDALIAAMCPPAAPPPVVSIDIPSG
jgi:NAD(P)H-hydrate epimerase